jgi:hypothetical protein
MGYGLLWKYIIDSKKRGTPERAFPIFLAQGKSSGEGGYSSPEDKVKR